MGRPIKKKFFGNTNLPPIGGEGVASITVSGTNDNYTVKPTVSIAAPSLPGGVQATAEVTSMGVASASVVAAGSGYTNGDVLTLVGLGTGTAATITVATVDTGGEILTFSVTTDGVYSTVDDVTALSVTGGTGNSATFDVTLQINSITVTNSGAGYISTSVPAVTTTPSGNATLTAVLADLNQNAIKISAFVVGGSSSVNGDIVKQESSRRYLVTTAQGTSQCRLVSAAPSAGEMTIIATDSSSKTYYVTKLTAHKALLTQFGAAGHEFATGTTVPWTLGAAVLNERVQVENQ